MLSVLQYGNTFLLLGYQREIDEEEGDISHLVQVINLQQWNCRCNKCGKAINRPTVRLLSSDEGVWEGWGGTDFISPGAVFNWHQVDRDYLHVSLYFILNKQNNLKTYKDLEI